MSIFSDIGDAVSGAVNAVENVACGAANAVEGLAGDAVNLAGGVLSGAGGLLCPLMSGALGPLSGLLSSLLGSLSGGQQSSPLPFSGAASLIGNPAQFASNLSSASSSLSSGLGQPDLGNIDYLENQANSAVNTANQPGSTQKQQLDAQQALINLQLAVEKASNNMNTVGEMNKKTTDNSRLQ